MEGKSVKERKQGVRRERQRERERERERERKKSER